MNRYLTLLIFNVILSIKITFSCMLFSGFNEELLLDFPRTLSLQDKLRVVSLEKGRLIFDVLYYENDEIVRYSWLPGVDLIKEPVLVDRLIPKKSVCFEEKKIVANNSSSDIGYGTWIAKDLDTYRSLVPYFKNGYFISREFGEKLAESSSVFGCIWRKSSYNPYNNEHIGILHSMLLERVSIDFNKIHRSGILGTLLRLNRKAFGNFQDSMIVDCYNTLNSWRLLTVDAYEEGNDGVFVAGLGYSINGGLLPYKAKIDTLKFALSYLSSMPNVRSKL